MCAIAAEVLGIGLEDIDIKRVDTAHTPVDPGTYGSRVTVLAGEATINAAKDAKRQLLEVAAKEFGVKPEEMEIKNKKAFVKANPEMSIPWARLVRMACYTTPGMVIIGRGQSSRGITTYGLADFTKGTGDIGTNYSFTAQAQEVEVDLETGVVKCTDNSVIAHDCGFPLNPPAVDTQVVGGAYHPGLGAALYCEFKMDKGLTLNPNLVDYKLPRAYEAPMTKVIHVITNDPFGPFGAKEASEGSTCTAAPAVINAIHDATGIWIKDLPAKPEKVFWALKEKRGEKRKEVDVEQTMRVVIIPGLVELRIKVDPTKESDSEGITLYCDALDVCSMARGEKKGVIEIEIKGETLRALLIELSDQYKQADVDFEPVNPKTNDVDFDYDVSVNGKNYVGLPKALIRN